VDVEAALIATFRAERGRLVASLIRMTGDWDLAEECVQDACAAAARRWPLDGVPRRPGAWLCTVARNCAVNRLRRRSAEAEKLRQLAALEPEAWAPGPDAEAPDGGEFEDDLLKLIFTCCHPALALESRIALTLRTVTGLSTAQIARAFLVSEASMAKRLVRAKSKIKGAGIPSRVPPAHLLPERVSGVMSVLYLLFTEGYNAPAGDNADRQNLCEEALYLAGLLVRMMPDEPEAGGLLALMLLHHARRAARVDEAGDLVTLEDQDRSRWDHQAIAEAVALLDRVWRTGRPGTYRLQAAVAACHATAARAEETNWPRIAGLYQRLAEVHPSAVVELNRAAAVAMAYGPCAGLALLDRIEASGALERYYLLAATRADLLRRLGRHREAAQAYRQALASAPTEAERRFLSRRLAETLLPH
jgi:RNA polymerase sigma-70 factor (ECF subfamily)